MLIIEGLNSGYGNFHILFDVNTVIPEGEITVVVGPNGSGKSTLLKSIFGLTHVHGGKINYNGLDLVGMPPHVVCHNGIAYLPQTENVFANLKVRENMRMAGYLVSKDELQNRLDEVLGFFPVLKNYWERKANTLSGGERQMLAMAMALIKKPKVIMFDEPTASLSPKLVTQVLDQIVQMRKDLGVTIILAEQNARKALEYGDHALLLVSGKLAFQGTPAELLNHKELGRLYLGLHVADA
jgi:branched-chain amino acid transport system ATP-binding protein